MSLELGLLGKTAIVTGSSAGIGLAIAKALYREGVSVAIAARDRDRFDRYSECDSRIAESEKSGHCDRG